MGVGRFVCGASAGEEWCGGVSVLIHLLGVFGWWNNEERENEFIWVVKIMIRVSPLVQKIYTTQNLEGKDIGVLKV
ncbi:hypothetical protein H5410_028789 [Solanum commersonii]|uniref:Uncharacterized protein n=1 Tax=Solanum commersonii TaxID=4109 RepID=A0A9J5Z347_SOLCO|nr:hypothetical protein H5410_028789 [Solanum commersonii]